MPSAAKQRLALLQDGDRRKLQNVGLLTARKIGVQVVMAATYAARVGHDPAPVIRNVLYGNAKLGHSGMVGLLTRGMAAAHLAGRRRVLITAAPRFRAGAGYKLAGSAYDEALDFLQQRLNLTPEQIAAIEQQYAPVALKVTQGLSGAVEKRMQQATRDATAQGLSVRDGVKLYRQELANAGVTPANDYALEAVFRTQVQTAYSAGRWQSLQDPDIDEILWGYEYAAIEDDRTTELCQDLDGTIRPKDDPIWSTYWPPNHFSCRSTTLEVFDDGKDHGDVPEDAPQAGFAYNPGQVFDSVDVTPVRVPFTIPARTPAPARSATSTSDQPSEGIETENPPLKFGGDVRFQDRGATEYIMRSLGLPGTPEDLVDATIPAGSIFREASVFQINENEIKIHAADEGSKMVRTVKRNRHGQLIVHNDYFELSDANKGKGLDIFRSQVVRCRQLGFEMMETHAAGQGDHVQGAAGTFNGYNTWARFGYDQKLTSDNKEHLPAEFQDAEYVSDLMATTEGQRAWRLHGNDLYDATFDLGDDSLNLAALRNYIKEKS